MKRSDHEFAGGEGRDEPAALWSAGLRVKYWLTPAGAIQFRMATDAEAREPWMVPNSGPCLAYHGTDAHGPYAIYTPLAIPNAAERHAAHVARAQRVHPTEPR